MVFAIIPDTNFVIDWRLLFVEIQPQLKKDFKDVFKVVYNNLSIEEEMGKFEITNYIYNLKKNYGLSFKDKKRYYSDKRDFNYIMKDILYTMDSVDSVCVITKTEFNKINKFMEKILDVIEFKSKDRVIFHYINTRIESEDKSKVTKVERNKYEIRSLHDINERD